MDKKFNAPSSSESEVVSSAKGRFLILYTYKDSDENPTRDGIGYVLEEADRTDHALFGAPSAFGDMGVPHVLAYGRLGVNLQSNVHEATEPFNSGVLRVPGMPNVFRPMFLVFKEHVAP